MPRIVLKPNSPEYADNKAKDSVKRCHMSGCGQKGDFKAPKHRGLNEYYFFCEAHVKEYNQAWNFFSGMSEREVQDHIVGAMYGHRPTWKYGVNGENPEDSLKERIWQTYNFTEEKPRRDHKTARAIDNASAKFQALALMGLAPPITLADIKARYKELAKKHHPDLNQGCPKSEELLKHINMAYTILKLAYDKFEELPERS